MLVIYSSYGNSILYYSSSYVGFVKCISVQYHKLPIANQANATVSQE